MRFGTILLAIVAVSTAAFLYANWPVFAAPATFHFLLASFEMPIGAIMIGVLGLAILTFATFVAIWQGTVLMNYRRQAKELQAQRRLADDAEASRFSELRTLLSNEMTTLSTRLEAAIEALRGEMRDSENSIAATLGEMDDRLGRSANRPTE